METTTRVDHPHGVRWLWAAAVWFLSAMATWAAPDTINEDFRVQVRGAAADWQTFPAEGWLHLERVPGTTKFRGTYTDNLNGGKTTPATGDDTDPNGMTVSVTSRYGKFAFQMEPGFATTDFVASTAALIVPARFAEANSAAYSRAHGYFPATYTATLDLSYGVPSSKAHVSNGTLHLIVDALRFIAPRDPVSGDISSLLVVNQTSAKLTPITAPGILAEVSLTNYDLNGINVTVNFNGKYAALLGRTSDSGATYSGGMACAGRVTAAASGAFRLVKQ